jgi:hypothetical protein
LFLGNTEFASNLTVRGSFNVETINYNNSNIVIYSSEEIRSNLLVEGVTEINSNLHVDGITLLSNQLNLFGSEVVYNGGTITLSNSTGASVLSANSNMMGINTVSPDYTLDVNGDINFTGLLYQNGSVFSGWNSNAFGNYINSNAAFKGPATAEDILLLYMSSNALAFTMSNSTGDISMYSSNAAIGVNTSNPLSMFDVAGDVHALDGMYAGSNKSFFTGLRADTLAGVSGATILRGDTWANTIFTTNRSLMSGLQLNGSTAGVDTAAQAGIVSAPSDRTLPVSFNELLTVSAGDVTTSNMFSLGAAFVDGSLSVIGGFTGNDATMKKMVLSGGYSNYHTDLVSSNSNVVLGGSYPFASSNAHLPNKLLEVHGDAALNANFALRSNAYVGGTMFLGSNMNSAPPSVPNAVAPEFSNVHLDVQGDIIVEGGMYTQQNLAVDGRFGVGVHSPAYPVDVQAQVEGVSMNCSGKVVSSEFVVYSDKRIKKDVVPYKQIASPTDLIDTLEVKRFSYIDGSLEDMIGFIAQEVEAVAPQCVDTGSSFIPDIFAVYTARASSDENVQGVFEVSMSLDTLSPETVSRLRPESLIKCKRGGIPNGDSFFATVVSFDTDSGLLKIRASIHDDEDILIVGTRVDDFKMVRYDQIGAIMVAALQQYGDRIRKLEAMMA